MSRTLPDLTLLLYILSQAVSAPSAKMVERLRDWRKQASPNFWPKFEPAIFCRQLELSPDQIERFLEVFKSDTVKDLQSNLTKHQISALHLFANDYPESLKQIADPPLILYLRGNASVLKTENAVAIVGSRRATAYGKQVLQQLVGDIAGAPLVIVSGLAFGIDALAHRGALQHGLPTVAVLGSGADDDNIYPRENFTLAQEILQAGGAIVSEYPPGESARKHQFVARNRIIAGLSRATIIVEAASKSGALITADFAMENGREVLAVPGPISSPQSAGPHKLIMTGAGLLESGTELLNLLDLAVQTTNVKPPNLTEPELLVLKYIQHEQITFEHLLAKTNLQVSQLQGVLSALELKRLISQPSPQTFYKL